MVGSIKWKEAISWSLQMVTSGKNRSSGLSWNQWEGSRWYWRTKLQHELAQGQNRRQISCSPNSSVEDDAWKGGDSWGVFLCWGMWSGWMWHCKQGKMTGLAVAENRDWAGFFYIPWSKTDASRQVMKGQWKLQWASNCQGPGPGPPLPFLGLHSSPCTATCGVALASRQASN